ncbi:MAG: flagellin [Synergistaceae bacterium]|nr:flagellin [Synergistaceae bacterium]
MDSVKRLATGLRVQNAADDAAGLAISEKMTAIIRGTDQAVRNAQDGQSMLNVAEGALNEIHSIIQRIRELAVQSANDSLTAEDRGYIQVEIDELTAQIDDIANQTQFNKKKILNGDSAVLWSTSTRDIEVVVTGNLTSKDANGQKVSAAGNYKLTFNAVQSGAESVQKSNIMYLKHGTHETGLVIDDASGLGNLRALNLVEGYWNLETRETPFGKVTAYKNTTGTTAPVTDTNDISVVQFTSSSTPNIVAPGEYDIRISDVVPMMAEFEDALKDGIVTGIDMSSRGATSDFDAVFDIDADTNGTDSNTIVYRDMGNVVDGTVTVGDVPFPGDTGTNIVNIETNADYANNIFTHFAVEEADARDVMIGDIIVTESYVAERDAVINLNLDYQTASGTQDQATVTYTSAGNQSVTFETTYHAKADTITLTNSKAVSIGGNMTLNQVRQAIETALGGSGSGITVSITGSAGSFQISIANTSGAAIKVESNNTSVTVFSSPIADNSAGQIGNFNVNDAATAFAVPVTTLTFSQELTVNAAAGDTVNDVEPKFDAALSGKSFWNNITFNQITTNANPDKKYYIQMTNTSGSSVSISSNEKEFFADVTSTTTINGKSLDYQTQTTINGLGNQTIADIGSAINAVTQSYGVNVSLTQSAGNVTAQTLSFAKTTTAYDFKIVDDTTSGSVEDELGMNNSVNFAHNATGSKATTNGVYDRYIITINTGGKDLQGLADALNNDTHLKNAAKVEIINGTTTDQQHLKLSAISMYNVSFSGGAIGELMNSSGLALTRSGITSTADTANVWVNHTVDVTVGDQDMVGIVNNLNTALNTLIGSAGDGLTLNNSLPNMFSLIQTGTYNTAGGEGQISLSNNADSAYKIEITDKIKNAADETGIDISVNRSNTQNGDQLAHLKTTRIDVDGKNIEETRDAIRTAGSTVTFWAEWTDAANTPSYDGDHHNGRLTLTNNTANDTNRRKYAITQENTVSSADMEGDVAYLFGSYTGPTIWGTNNTGSQPANSNIIQARDRLRLKITWDGNAASDASRVHSGTPVYVELWEGDNDTNQTHNNTQRVKDALNPTALNNLITLFEVKDNVDKTGTDGDNASDLHDDVYQYGADSWMLYTKAKVNGTADNINLSLYDGKYTDPNNNGGVTTGIVYSFYKDVLDSGYNSEYTQGATYRPLTMDELNNAKNVQIYELVRAHRGVDGEESLVHNLQIGKLKDATIKYGERQLAGTYWENTAGVDSWYSHAYYGPDTTYYFENDMDPADTVRKIVVDRQNKINASMLFIWGEGTFTVLSKSFDRDGQIETEKTEILSASQMADMAAGKPVTIHGIEFTLFDVDLGSLGLGDKFVVNVAAAAMLDGVNDGSSDVDGDGGSGPEDRDDFQSTANVAVSGDPWRQREDVTQSWGSSAQYRLANGKEDGLDMKLFSYYVDPINGSLSIAGVGYYDGQFEMKVDADGFDKRSYTGLQSTVGAPGGDDAGTRRIHAEVNYQGSLAPVAGALVTSVYFQKMETEEYHAVKDFVRAVGYSNYLYGSRADGSYGPMNEAGGEVYNPLNASLIFDVIKVTNNALTFRVQAHVIDLDGNQWYVEDEEFCLNASNNTSKNSTAVPPAIPNEVNDPVIFFQDAAFGGLYFDEFTLMDSDRWSVGDRFTLALTASGQMSGQEDSTIDEITLFSDQRGTSMPMGYRFKDGVLDNSTIDLGIYQLANNIAKPDSDHYSKDQVMDGTLSLSFGEYHPAGSGGKADTVRDAAKFESTFERGMDAGVAHYYSKMEDIKQFWDANGVFILANNNQQLTVRQNDREINITIGSGEELGKLVEYMSDRIWVDLLMQYDGVVRGKDDEDSVDYNPYLMREKDKREIISLVNRVPGESPNESVVGTLVAHSVIPSKESALKFYGSEELMKAFAFVEIKEAKDTVFNVSVSDAHSGELVKSGVKVNAGERAYKLIADGVALDIDGDLGLIAADYNSKRGVFESTIEKQFVQYVHLADNAATLQTGASEGENMVLTLGAVTAKALGINNLDVRGREAAARSVTRLDSASRQVSAQRAIIGAQINRLDHAIAGLNATSQNLTESLSRIVDADMAKEMMEFTKLNILAQVSSSIMSQANTLPQNVLTFLR